MSKITHIHVAAARRWAGNDRLEAALAWCRTREEAARTDRGRRESRSGWDSGTGHPPVRPLIDGKNLRGEKKTA